MKTKLFVTAMICGLLFGACKGSGQVGKGENRNLVRAQMTLDSIYTHYGVADTELLRENYPFDDQYRAGYLASQENNQPNPYAYLWPYSGTFSAVNALFESTGDKRYKTLLDERVLPGLEEYYDTRREPAGYASYVNSAPQSDRFYDDNVWLGIDFTDFYHMTGEAKYLDKARIIWEFVMSGCDDVLGGGIYWCEQKKHSKNTCSNAPGAVFAFKLFEATGDSIYYHQGAQLYAWTKGMLQDPTDYLYFDNLGLDYRLGRAKFAYNSGQMMQAAALQYKLTGEESFLVDAHRLAKACHNYFFTDFTTPAGDAFKMINKGDVWFTAVMLRGYIELYKIDKDPVYLNDFNKSLDYAWEHARNEAGLFGTDFKAPADGSKKWLLTQAAMVEMYARLGEF